MIELPEAYTLANQLGQAFVGKTIVSAAANTSPHGFAWYSGDPALYNDILAGRKIAAAAAYGGRLPNHSVEQNAGVFLPRLQRRIEA